MNLGRKKLGGLNQIESLGGLNLNREFTVLVTLLPERTRDHPPTPNRCIDKRAPQVNLIRSRTELGNIVSQ
jgi:hypothetical protein